MTARPNNVGRQDIFRCTSCDYEIVTEERDPGDAPLYLGECPVEGCDGFVRSVGNEVDLAGRNPTHYLVAQEHHTKLVIQKIEEA